jgi:uncharacterized membrane protein YeaQ/YmgE (transglycosylase-associated protein family)
MPFASKKVLQHYFFQKLYEKGAEEENMNILWLIFVGLIAGWLATELVEGGASGIFEFMVVGVVGSMLGGLVVTRFGLTVAEGFLGSVVTATIGAIILIFGLRVIIHH